MLNDFHDTDDSSSLIQQTLLSKPWESIPVPPAILATLLLGPLVIFLTAQLLLIGVSGNARDGKDCDLWTVPFQPIPWRILESFFGIPKKAETVYETALNELNACTKFLLDEPHLTKIFEVLVKNLERNIPQMISFIETPIDFQPWEQYAEACFISSSETEINLTSLIRDMMGYAAVPSIFGPALIENNPSILQDVRNMDAGRNYLLKNVPPWMPWPAVALARMARSKVWQSLEGHQKFIDVATAEEEAEPSWGDLCDILWSLAANSTLIPYWQLHHILAIPGLTDRIRTEIMPYASVTKPFSIGKISEAPKLVLDYKGLSTKCPLLRSTYLETLRLVDEQWDSRKTFTPGIGAVEDLAHPGEFNPERYIPVGQDNTVMPPESKHSSLQKSNTFTEIACISLLAGILAFWEISLGHEGAGWEVPEKRNLGGVAVPANETRVRIQRRKFEWME
ncbi:cytochrome P [Marssonina coronariae]|uniref:Cytochrome P n=1 Tax=Diplocarpon coronariae TaxID=2795749 RepID=A0A218YWQ9_9HELO|nr:cytochrome P [Marssonina coronariae]